jgi:hypothetical protein
MEDKLISFETAKLAKEKGLDLEFCNVGWHGDFGDLKDDSYPFLGTYSFYKSIYCNNKCEHEIQRPTQAILQQWLLENHGLFVSVELAYSKWGRFAAIVEKESKDKETSIIALDGFTIFNKYEEAFEEGLFEALKLI